MSMQVHDKIATGEARIVELPATEAKRPLGVDRSFGLPPILYGATVACYLGFLAITGMAFMNPVLAIPIAVFTIFIFAGFGVPAIFTRLKGNDSKPLSFGAFANWGIMTHTGPLAPRDATIQVLLLPALIVMWALAVVAIVAVVA
jgi:hypothetical protein